MNKGLQQELIALAVNGDERAFGLLCESVYPDLMRYGASLCNDRELAVDAVQDVLLKMSQSLRKLTSVGVFQSWCFQALRWRVLDLIRKRNSRQKYETSAASEDREVGEGKVEPLRFDSTEYEVINRDCAMGQAIEKLPFVERDAVYLFYLLELDLTEISQIQRVPKGTVKSRLHRARQALKQNVKPEEN